MAFEMGWVKKVTKADNKGNLKTVNDYSAVKAWVTKYGYLKKPLNRYTYNELPKLVRQFEQYIYNPYIQSKPKK